MSAPTPDLTKYKNTLRAFESSLGELAALARELITTDDPLATKAILGYEQVSASFRAYDDARRASRPPYEPIDTGSDMLRTLDHRLHRSILQAVRAKKDEEAAAAAAEAAAAREAMLTNLRSQVSNLEDTVALQQEAQRRKEAADAHLAASLESYRQQRAAEATKAAAEAAARAQAAATYVRTNEIAEALRRRAQAALKPTPRPTPTMAHIVAGLLAKHRS